MITVEKIQKLVEEKLLETDNFLVNITVGPGNSISVEIDNDNGIKVADCVAVSRHIEGSLDRDVEDYSLDVASPGLGRPFKTERQYQKYLTKKVEVVTKDGLVHEGVLLSKNDTELQLEVEKGKKGAKKTIEIETISLSNVKETKSVISFK